MISNTRLTGVVVSPAIIGIAFYYSKDYLYNIFSDNWNFMFCTEEDQECYDRLVRIEKVVLVHIKNIYIELLSEAVLNRNKFLKLSEDITFTLEELDKIKGSSLIAKKRKVLVAQLIKLGDDVDKTANRA